MIHFLWPMRFLAGCLALAVSACGTQSASRLAAGQEGQIRAEIERTMREAYDLSRPNVAERMLSLYSDSGRVISATGGRVVSSRDSLEAGIRYFWNYVGTNMRQPRWLWDRFFIDVLSPTNAVATATYRVPHRTPRDEPHELAGAITAVFEKRGGRWVIIQEHLSDVPAPSAADSASTSMPTHDHP